MVNCCTGAVAILQGAVLIRFSIVGVQKSSESYFDGSEWRRVAMLIVGIVAMAEIVRDT